MNENYLKSTYEHHKNDSKESLKKIINNPNKYSQEVVYAAKTILLNNLETENLGIQYYIGKQHVADRLITNLKELNWR